MVALMRICALFFVLALVSAAPKSRKSFYESIKNVVREYKDLEPDNNVKELIESEGQIQDKVVRAEHTGCTDKELAEMTSVGIDIDKTNIDCTVKNEKRGCSFVYTATSACCSPQCNWIMEFHCMSPSQMVCKK